MKTLIVFNGGTEGGLLLTPNGVFTAPPFEADVLNSLKATARLVLAMNAARDQNTQSKLSKMAIGAANLSVEMIENLLGPLDPERAIVFQDPDGGFTCGSTGKPPLPVPWPPRPFKDANDLIKAGVIEADVLELLRESKAKGKDFTKVFEEPAAAAKELGLSLSAKSAEDLSQLAPSKVSKVQNPVDREMLNLFHAVLKDGRFTETWFDRPHEVARLLKVEISDTAVERIVNVGGLTSMVSGLPSLRSDSAICAGIIWAGVCIAVGTLFVGQMNPIDTFVRDHSGRVKF
jgi:hypothetical protein